MKHLRFLLVLGCALSFGLTVRAADEKEKPKQPAGCDCAKDKDGKTCGVEKDCCCTGSKASCPVEKKDEKPADKKDEKKPADKPKS